MSSSNTTRRQYPKDPCWTHVTRTPSGRRHDQITCKYCNFSWHSSDVERACKHLLRCPSVPPELEEQVERQYQPRAPPPRLVDLSQPTNRLPLPNGVPNQQPQGGQQQHVAYQTSTDSTEPLSRFTNASQEEIQNSCARWIYKCGISPSILEQPAFRNMMRELNPAFVLPTRSMLAASLALQKAIDSASQPNLANTLQEICERSESGREIAMEMLMPNPPVVATVEPVTRGRRRRAESSEAIDRTCQNREREFANGVQLARDCRYHPGKTKLPRTECSSVCCTTKLIVANRRKRGRRRIPHLGRHSLRKSKRFRLV